MTPTPTEALPTIAPGVEGWCLRGRHVQHAFANPEITRLVAPIHAGNARSMRVAEKAGFTLESVQRRSAIKAGRVIDRHVDALVRD